MTCLLALFILAYNLGLYTNLKVTVKSENLACTKSKNKSRNRAYAKPRHLQVDINVTFPEIFLTVTICILFLWIICLTERQLWISVDKFHSMRNLSTHVK